MDIEMIKIQIIEILEELSSEKISDTSLLLVNDLGLDSLCMVMLLIMLEETFEIELDESDMNPFLLLTVEDVINLVAKYKIESEGEQNG